MEEEEGQQDQPQGQAHEHLHLSHLMVSSRALFSHFLNDQYPQTLTHDSLYAWMQKEAW